MNGYRIVRAEAFVHPVRTRMPFRYGMAEMRALPHVFVQVELEQGGRRTRGVAADHLVPKWFTKNAKTTPGEDISEMRRVILAACDEAGRREAETPFALWWDLYHRQLEVAEGEAWPPLLAGLGASLIERAMIDGFCRMERLPFAEALSQNRLGIELGRIHPELEGRRPAEFLPKRPLEAITARHTVGLADPLFAADLAAGEWPRDELPVSLEDVIAAYGVTRFKIKIGGDTSWNLQRLAEIARLLEEKADPSFAFTLDGNESYASIEDFASFWSEAATSREFSEGWWDHLVFVEQPLRRDVALKGSIREALAGGIRPPRVIIDESDDSLETLPRALACGYAGSTHKNCKGVFKSVANLSLLKIRGGEAIFSGEDLTNIGPIALLEDLCVVQALGLSDIERNGHHYFRGIPAFSPGIRTAVLEHHSDLFGTLPDGCPSVAIRQGRMSGRSLNRAGLGPAFEFDPAGLPSLRDWQPDAMG